MRRADMDRDTARAGTSAATYDALVVGFGAAGSWAAKELTEGGLRVALLEAGRNLNTAC
ncbi:FAD-binding protein [Mycobacterium sp. SM1]|uniref:FAD-binding protein n=1 Tax=Mycobacterium sp. SM1 TaxID=2816243 RepID=UPI001BCAA285|nr:FAD-binding protein [Mycobacterium sp. SM1]MBS4729539.1 FAD-binding protein [Mycobacterium sp. SM1]